MKRFARPIIALAAVLWIAAIVGGGSALLRYSATGGPAEHAPAMWPADSGLPRRDGMTVLMFAHPFCACTNASLAELDRMLTASRMSATVVFLDPGTAGHSWRESRLVERARAIHGVEVVFDEAGTEARLFGAGTSGHVVVYDAGAALRYAGGLTQARGHEGWAAGQQTLTQIFAGASPSDTVSPTYGCALSGPPEFADKGN